MSYGRIRWSIVATAVLLAGGAVYMMSLSGAIAQQARLYPLIFLWGILLGSVLLAVNAVLPAFVSRLPEEAPEEQEGPSDVAGWPLYVLLLAYVFLLDRAGFIVATLLFLLPGLLWLRTPVHVGVLLAVVGVLAIFVVFRTVMYVSLPAGPADIYLLELIYGGWRR